MNGSAGLLAPPVGLAGSRVHRLGAEILLDEHVSWCPEGVRRRQPVNAYLIRGEGGAVLVDTGVRRHEAEVLQQLDELLDPGEPITILLTRTEMECCLNVPAIEARRPVDAVWYTGGITVPRSTAPARRVSVEPGTSLDVELRPGVVLQLVSPLLRLLPTLWVYDPPSGVLLTSDAFTYARGDGEAGDPMEGLVKFRWFGGADTRPIARDVLRVIGSRRVTAIGPGYGFPFVGEAECRREAARLAACLEEVGGR
ncbi:MBL fold metallo-hydrolase [Sinomonas sp. ASV322]|uniref:MBL fold metallo-hydrolase n=1 Tax=Sinomonas sp. ASV322 TaxID=3041920 RepID=UPI0027DC1372|nr:MBL fold metallo-hydrolase [Sinomonas sp. ASV322]MDQ4503544.1 MBL fold metallo-hydrolase [Sinomonas sp. ASV322]